ncbi:MAG: DNA-3-methyladenine glycosylase 2 family protein [Verrucomicrobia bacterium]|nr:DNA-3-methyladenine glycosylase 2 family protein [Verrucomicrobiota bacterium]
MKPATQVSFPVRDYDLAATLGSGQAFRWRLVGDAWEGIISGHHFRLRQTPAAITAELLGSTSTPATPELTHGTRNTEHASALLRHLLQLDADLPAILATFPDDKPMRAAVAACRGLRLLRQEPWECLVSFICSSTKQIVQIQQIIALLCERFGEPIPVGDDVRSLKLTPEKQSETPHVVTYEGFAFPTAARLAACSEAELRTCKMGFRAPYILAAAKAVASGALDLSHLHNLPTAEARAALMNLHGVGRKIADCVLLFAYGKQDAFPVDVWVRRALTEMYFPRRRPSEKRLERFANTHFGPNAGYAQQYLFHYVRVKKSG